MPWQELQIQVSEQAAEMLGELLNELGALAVSFHDAGDQPLYEPDIGTTPLWQQTKVHGLFSSDSDINEIVNQIQTQFSNETSLQYKIITIEDKNWQQEYQDNFKAICINDRLWICPSWDNVTIQTKNSIIIHLDPGLAFGTGNHATTRLCLTWLTKQISNQATVIDYGCGSGILGISALKLGAHEVWAIDIDPQALQATRDNAKKNNINPKQLHTELPDNLPQLQADVLVANILALPLINLAPHFAKMVKIGGDIILSGLLYEQHDMILAAYADYFELNKCEALDEWICLSGKRI